MFTRGYIKHNDSIKLHPVTPLSRSKAPLLRSVEGARLGRHLWGAKVVFLFRTWTVVFLEISNQKTRKIEWIFGKMRGKKNAKTDATPINRFSTVLLYQSSVFIYIILYEHHFDGSWHLLIRVIDQILLGHDLASWNLGRSPEVKTRPFPGVKPRRFSGFSEFFPSFYQEVLLKL